MGPTWGRAVHKHHQVGRQFLVTDPAWREGAFLSTWALGHGPAARMTPHYLLEGRPHYLVHRRHTLLYCTPLYCAPQVFFWCFVFVFCFLTDGKTLTSKKITTGCIVLFTALQESGTNPAVSPRFACTRKANTQTPSRHRHAVTGAELLSPARHRYSTLKHLHIKLPRTGKLSKGEDQSAVIF